MEKKVNIFDTTLRDGEQVPGCGLNKEEKIIIAKALEQLGVDVIEAGFPISSPGDFASVKAIAQNVKEPVICALSRAVEKDIIRAVEALEISGPSGADFDVLNANIRSQLPDGYTLRVLPSTRDWSPRGDLEEAI